LISILVADISGRKVIKNEASTEFPFLTGSGRNGVRSYEIKEPDRNTVFDLTGKDLRLVIKTNESATNTELDASFPLTPSITLATAGTFTVDFSAINFVSFQSKVVFILYDVTGGEIIPISKMESSIQIAGV